MFIDIIAAVIMTVAGVGFIGFGLLSRKGIFTLIGGLLILMLPAMFEGYSVTSWQQTGEVATVSGNVTTTTKTYDDFTVEYPVMPLLRGLVGVGIATVLFVVLRKQGLG